MYFPLNREKCFDAVQLSIKRLTLDIAMLESVTDALKTYTRKTCGKYLFDHIKSLAPCVVYAYNQGTIKMFKIVGNDRILTRSEPDKNGYSSVIYREDVTIYLREKENETELDQFSDGVRSRLEGMREGHAQLNALESGLSATLDRYEQAAKTIEEILDIPGIYALNEYVHRLAR